MWKHCDTLPSSAPNQGDNTVSVAKGSTTTPGATKQLLPLDRVLKELYIYIYIRQINQSSRDYIGRSSSFLVCSLWLKKTRLLSAVDILVLRNHTGMVVPRAFHSCRKLLAFDQIQLDAYCAVVWRRSEATFKLRAGIPIFERNETTTTNLNMNHVAYPTFFHAVGNHMAYPTFFHAVSHSGFLPLVCFLPVFFPGDSQFYEASLLWIGPRYNVCPVFCLNNVNWEL